MNCKNYILYKIYYGNELVYIGRTSQDLIGGLTKAIQEHLDNVELVMKNVEKVLIL